MMVGPSSDKTSTVKLTVTGPAEKQESRRHRAGSRGIRGEHGEQL